MVPDVDETAVRSTQMAVEFALFRDDDLLARGQVLIGAPFRRQLFPFQEQGRSYELAIEHSFEQPACPLQVQVVETTAAGAITVVDAALRMGVHKSEDWESLPLLSYTLAFRREPSV